MWQVPSQSNNGPSIAGSEWGLVPSRSNIDRPVSVPYGASPTQVKYGLVHNRSHVVQIPSTFSIDLLILDGIWASPISVRHWSTHCWSRTGLVPSRSKIDRPISVPCGATGASPTPVNYVYEPVHNRSHVVRIPSPTRKCLAPLDGMWRVLSHPNIGPPIAGCMNLQPSTCQSPHSRC
jgi:hypothetical protein